MTPFSTSMFNLAKPVGCNYWSDWTTPDDDRDGFVDEPYVISEWVGLQDNLPWTVSNGWLTAPQRILALVQDVEALNFQHGILNSLDAKLEAAVQALDDVNQCNNVAAINTLRAFINAVRAQSGNKLAEEEANDLIAQAQAIIDLLNVQPGCGSYYW